MTGVDKAEENWFWEERDQHASEKFKRIRAFYLVFPAFGDFIFGSRPKKVLLDSSFFFELLTEPMFLSTLDKCPL